jgi:Cu+-exporting ATPase
MQKNSTETTTNQICYHCGENCEPHLVTFDDKPFCCEGCSLVYELLSENNLCTYYTLDQNPGISRFQKHHDEYQYLEDADLKASLITFSNGLETHITFHVPSMHCSSCVYLLENMHRLNPGVMQSTVNFPRKEVAISFKESETSLSAIASLMSEIGYEPHISLESAAGNKGTPTNRIRIFKIGLAGFAFGNIMMLSFPEYFSLGNYFDQENLKYYFGYISMALSLPVLFYAASEFFITGIKGLLKGYLNIDLPIALAILITFGRSVYELFYGNGAGYFDSMTGIVFFMLIGRYFQDRTYETLSFDRDYKSFFPLSVIKISKGVEEVIPVNNIIKGDHILVRNNELIPVDAMLLKGAGKIDYSFVTGEAEPVEKNRGELLYAGGKQVGGSLTLAVLKTVSQSYLTKLWNKEVFQERETQQYTFVQTISKYFTLVLFAITAAAFFYWLPQDLSRAINALTTTLIIACPCALLLAATFTHGNSIRQLGKKAFYLKNASILEKLAKINVIVFDKTGTITEAKFADVVYKGAPLSTQENQLLKALFKNSAHPLSKRIHDFIKNDSNIELANFEEIPGKGMVASYLNFKIKVGSEQFILGEIQVGLLKESIVYVEINHTIKGYFSIKNVYRNGFAGLIARLKNKFELMVLSGDQDSERSTLQFMLGDTTPIYFKQSPSDKLQKIAMLQAKGKKVMMIGDGLNDAGALRQSDVGIAITDQTNYFSPASDIIMDGKSFAYLDRFIQFAKTSKKIIVISFAISLLYNVIGLFYAVQGNLSPVVAAILMPISSISIVLFTTIATAISAKISL